MAEIIDGRKIAGEILRKVRDQFKELVPLHGAPKLVSVLVGEQKDAELYVNVQKKNAESVGLVFENLRYPLDIKEETLLAGIKELNRDKSVTAIIVQHPLPPGIGHDRIIHEISPAKDAEGITPCNLGMIFRREAEIVPCTPGAVMKMLRSVKVELYGKNVVIIGHSAIVGKPLGLMMLNETATTTVCHIGTAEKGDIKSHTRSADILVVAVGKPEMVKADWVKEGAVVIDVGINNRDGRIVGDVDHAAVSKKASMITPVPGGVGPVTVSILMRNVLRAYKAQHGEIQG
jgi:methylenetetrahydrofolate dehydrogenase (NADP+)/methenyltetrahydrofolate cyclohydrolase